MEKLKEICYHLEECLESELEGNKDMVSTKEVGEVADAIKDIHMAIYYASIVDAMKHSEYGKDYDATGRMMNRPMA